jgi:hypothetical protein
MFNDEQLAHMKTRAIEYDPACVDCRHDAVKDPAGTTWQCAGHVRAERDWLRARLALKWTIEEQYEAACGDRDALAHMVETLRGEVAALTTERNAALALAEQRGAAYDMTWREVESLRERLDKSDEERGRQYGLRLEIADEFAGEVAFLRELLVAVIKTGTKDPLLDARIAEELRGPGSVPAPQPDEEPRLPVADEGEKT